MNILNKLTIKHLKMNKKRTIVTIIGVMLSTALMVGIGLLFSSVRDATISEIIYSTGDYHAEIKNVSIDKLDIIKKDNKIKNYYYYNEIGYANLDSENEYKPYLYVVGASNNLFDELNLIEGRMPNNSNELVISEHIISNGNVNLKVGDKLDLKLGVRYIDNNKLTYLDEYNVGETLKIFTEKSYTIVGIVSRNDMENYSSPGYYVFTKKNNDSNIDIFIKYKQPAKTYDYIDGLAKELGVNETSISFNDTLIGMYGASKYNNLTGLVYNIMAIVLSLISVGCIVVIYNSFAISVMERKKQFGLFSSIGATPRQLRFTVLFEALIIALIGIPLGIIASFIGIGTVLQIINNLLKDMFQIPFRLSIYPMFIIIPLIFMIIVVFVSAFIPAIKASKISPIDAIRLNTDIKIKRGKLKTNHLISKIFGIEGDMALKNIKRNKGKYRITILSLIVSIVLFISFSSFIMYGIESSEDFLEVTNYDIIATYRSFDDSEKYAKSFIAESDKGNYYDSIGVYTSSYYNINIPDFIESEEELFFMYILIFNDKEYNNYLKELGYNEEKPILLNSYNYMNYSDGKRVLEKLNKYKDNSNKFDVCEIDFSNQANEKEQYQKKCSDNIIDDYYLSNKSLYYISMYDSSSMPIFIMNKGLADKYISTFSGENKYTNVILQAKNRDPLLTVLKDAEDKLVEQDYYYIDVNEATRQSRNIILVIKILVYGFIALVTLIGVTSVFNTINTSIALRRKEFSILRSIGLTSKGFNKMLFFESLFFGLKSLLYGIPISIGIVYLIYKSVTDIVIYDYFMLPWKYILIAVFGVFIIIIVSMYYSTKKIKHENIIDTIREENI